MELGGTRLLQAGLRIMAQALSSLCSKLFRNGPPVSGGTPSFVSRYQWILKADQIPVSDSREVPPEYASTPGRTPGESSFTRLTMFLRPPSCTKI
jgi:hypothetical protein